MAINNSSPPKIPDFKAFFKSHRKSLARSIGTEAVRHFKENFRQEGFVNNGLQKWKDVKRRDPASPWYGFEYKGEKRADYPVKRRKRGQRLKSTKRLNFSPAATRRKILTGSSGELQRSLAYRIDQTSADGIAVAITSDKPYAAVQNEGGTIRVFGKAPAMLPARPFVGYSKELNDEIARIIDNEFQKFLNK